MNVLELKTFQLRNKKEKRSSEIRKKNAAQKKGGGREGEEEENKKKTKQMSWNNILISTIYSLKKKYRVNNSLHLWSEEISFVEE